MSSSTSKTPAVATRRAMLSHTSWVEGVAHLPGRRQIITCAVHDSLRLWDVESGAQIGEDWRDGSDLLTGVRSMALSPNGKMIVSGSRDNNNVRVWNVEARKDIAKWEGHTKFVGALSWSADSKQVLSGSWDGTARAWDVKSGKTVLAIKTGHEVVQVVIYSPDATKIATGGLNENAVKIWDAKTGELFKTLKHDHQVYSLAWTLEGKKLISGSFDPIRIFDTVTWEEIAVLKGHTDWINAISLSQNDRVLASASGSRVHLWNLDTNLQVGPLIQHENEVRCAALSADGKLLVTGCEDENAYTWDVHAMLKEAGLEDLLKPIFNVPVQKSLMNGNATRRPPIQARQIPAGFFDGVQNSTQSSTVRGTHPRSPVHHSRSTRALLLERFSSLFHHSYRNTGDANELQQRQSRSIFSRGPPIVEVAAVKDREVIFTVPPPPQKTQQQTQSYAQGSSTIPPAPDTNPTTPPKHPHSLPVRLFAHLVLFLCCASQHANGNAQPIQQQDQPQGEAHAQASSSQTQPTASSTSTMPPAPALSTASSGPAIVQPRPLPLRARFVLFICCASPPHADGH